MKKLSRICGPLDTCWETVPTIALPCCRLCFHIPSGKDMNEGGRVRLSPQPYRSHSLLRVNPEAVIKRDQRSIWSRDVGCIKNNERPTSCPRFQLDNRTGSAVCINVAVWEKGWLIACSVYWRPLVKEVTVTGAITWAWKITTACFNWLEA